MTRLFLLFVFVVLNLTVYCQCNESSLIVSQIRAQDTDSDIDWELARHFTYFNPDCSQRGILVLHLVGSYDNPINTTLFPKFAANNGFHAICLKYPNSTAAQTVCANSNNADCYANFRQEIIEGVDVSSDVTVDETNSINNRLIKLLKYLQSDNPGQNWDNYYLNDSIIWGNIIVSGHSQGGGHAAYIAKKNHVKRCLMFASPNDYSNTSNSPANWISSSSLTPEVNYYGFNNLYDDVVDFSDQFDIWNNLNIDNFGDTLNVDISTNYNNSHQLYTTQTGSNANDNHSLMIRDEQVPLDGNNKSIFEPVWSYMLGIDIGLNVTYNEIENDIKLYPTPINDILNITFNGHKTDYNVSILDLNGKLIKQFIINQSSTVNLKDLNQGIYILEVKSEDKVLTRQKIIKN